MPRPMQQKKPLPGRGMFNRTPRPRFDVARPAVQPQQPPMSINYEDAIRQGQAIMDQYKASNPQPPLDQMYAGGTPNMYPNYSQPDQGLMDQYRAFQIQQQDQMYAGGTPGMYPPQMYPQYGQFPPINTVQQPQPPMQPMFQPYMMPRRGNGN